MKPKEGIPVGGGGGGCSTQQLGSEYEAKRSHRRGAGECRSTLLGDWSSRKEVPPGDSRFPGKPNKRRVSERPGKKDGGICTKQGTFPEGGGGHPEGTIGGMGGGIN